MTNGCILYNTLNQRFHFVYVMLTCSCFCLLPPPSKLFPLLFSYRMTTRWSVSLHLALGCEAKAGWPNTPHDNRGLPTDMWAEIFQQTSEWQAKWCLMFPLWTHSCCCRLPSCHVGLDGAFFFKMAAHSGARLLELPLLRPFLMYLGAMWAVMSQRI